MSAKQIKRYRTASDFNFGFVSSDSGNPIREDYADCIDDYGVPGVNVVGHTDFDQLIQASADSCDIYKIIERAHGDETVYDQVQKKYLNVLDAPESLAEAYQRAADMQNAFDALPSAVKSLFGNNVFALQNELASGTAEGKIKNLYDSVSKSRFKDLEKSVKKEVTENE